MSLKRIKRLMEGSYDIHEDSLQSTIDDLHETLKHLDSILEDETHGANEDVIRRAKAVKEHILKAIEEGRPEVAEDFDGTLSDLGQLPKLPFGIVDARKGGTTLSGASPTKKRKKRRKIKENFSFTGRTRHLDYSQEEIDEAMEIYNSLSSDRQRAIRKEFESQKHHPEMEDVKLDDYVTDLYMDDNLV